MPLAPKPDLSHVRRALMTYAARGHEAGDQLGGRRRGDWLERGSREWLRHQLGKVVGHVAAELDELETGGAGAVDQESGVLHLALAAARLNMALAGAVAARILPADPVAAKKRR